MSDLGLPELSHVPGSGAWAMLWGGTRLDIRMHSAALVVDYFGPETGAAPPPLWEGWREHDLAVNARLPGMVEVGARPVCVAWRLAGWHQPDAASLAIDLVAEESLLACTVQFAVDPPTGLLLRRTLLHHAGPPGSAPIEVTGALSFWTGLRMPVEEATYLSGTWGAEGQVRALAGGHAALLLDSRVGKTGFEFQPWLVLRGQDGVHLYQLLWSGNWSIEARIRPATTTVAGGLNAWGLSHRLAAGEQFALPEALLGHVAGGLGAAVMRLHDWRRARRPDPQRPVPVQFNTWYACDEDVSEARLLPLVAGAAALGCEVFVIDAGWYTTHAHDPAADWYTRTGDWLVDPRRFPTGLAPIRAACAAAGMGLGIWCEPEAVGPGARLRAEHPDWLHHIDGHAPAPGRRAVLHLGVPAAWAHALAMLTDLLEQTGAAWLKWDFNADLGAGGWAPGLPESLAGQDPMVAHIQGLYRLQDALRARFPHMILEMCASGGGRMDAAILARAHTNWLSDQPQAVAKLAIHFGMQRAHPAICCNDWLVDWPPRAYSGVDGIDRRGDLAFRLRVAMLGSFGISAPIEGWGADDLAIAAAHVALYRSRLRALVHHGDMHQLTAAPPLDGQGGWAAIWYVAKDGGEGALFAFRLADGPAEQDFALPGLLPGPHDLAGQHAELLPDGVRVSLPEPFSSALLLVSATPERAA